MSSTGIDFIIARFQSLGSDQSRRLGASAMLLSDRTPATHTVSFNLDAMRQKQHTRRFKSSDRLEARISMYSTAWLSMYRVIQVPCSIFAKV